MHTLTMNLSDAEKNALDEICIKQELSQEAAMRQALRMYQLFALGEVKLLWKDGPTKAAFYERTAASVSTADLEAGAVRKLVEAARKWEAILHKNMDSPCVSNEHAELAAALTPFKDIP